MFLDKIPFPELAWPVPCSSFGDNRDLTNAGVEGGVRSCPLLPPRITSTTALALGTAGPRSQPSLSQLVRAGFEASCLSVVSGVCTFALIVSPRGFFGRGPCHLLPETARQTSSWRKSSSVCSPGVPASRDGEACQRQSLRRTSQHCCFHTHPPLRPSSQRPCPLQELKVFGFFFFNGAADN